MIEYLKGEVTDLEPTKAIVECGGVGYECIISVYTYDKIKKGEINKLYISESIREDAHVLHGFISKQERAIYNLLVSVSGVGPSTAQCIQSSLSPDELVGIISTGNDRLLKNVKGIGGKTAQRIIVDLKDKIGNLGIISTDLSGNAANAISKSENGDEAIQALMALGYPQSNATKAISSLLAKDPTMSVQALIKAGLRMM
ncbi:MAG: Holliday junction branch migration protein RuvA [Bacteroidales bacterium]|nr:Holliday junction branch migration protein RuvA [Bacteroidales bacterium]